MIHDEQKKQIQEILAQMEAPVKLVHFTQEINVEFAREGRKLLEELSELSDKLSLEVFNLQIDREKAAAWGIDKVPATAIVGGGVGDGVGDGTGDNEKDYGIRFYGAPMGYEFSSLLDAIVSVSKADSGLESETRETLQKLTRPLHLMVFVTPT